MMKTCVNSAVWIRTLFKAVSTADGTIPRPGICAIRIAACADEAGFVIAIDAYDAHGASGIRCQIP